jgi:hypothetical protein
MRAYLKLDLNIHDVEPVNTVLEIDMIYFEKDEDSITCYIIPSSNKMGDICATISRDSMINAITKNGLDSNDKEKSIDDIIQSFMFDSALDEGSICLPNEFIFEYK